MSETQFNKRLQVVTLGRDDPASNMSVLDAMRLISQRVLDRSNLYVPMEHKQLSAAASNTVPGPASITELARALKNDPDLIYEWVYNNVEYHPTFGLEKGGLGCLIDGIGNSFDQCDLLFSLLTVAGFTPSFVSGQILLSPAQAASWLGTDPTDVGTSYSVLNNGGIPVQFFGANILVGHLWISVSINATTYVFDPSIKAYTTTPAINLATTMGYTQAAFLASAKTGATVDPSGNFIQNVNRTNLRSQLATYATNLQSWIQSNNPTARLEDVSGGRTINQISAPVRLTSLPYEAPGDMPTLWTAIPDSFKATINLFYGSITKQFFSSDVHGQRGNLFYNSVDSEARTPVKWRSYCQQLYSSWTRRQHIDVRKPPLCKQFRQSKLDTARQWCLRPYWMLLWSYERIHNRLLRSTVREAIRLWSYPYQNQCLARRLPAFIMVGKLKLPSSLKPALPFTRPFGLSTTI